MDSLTSYSSQTGVRRKPPLYLRFRSSKWLICTIIFVATFTDGFVYGIIVPVLPFSLVDRSGVKQSEVQFWISTLLALHGASMAVAGPIAGWLADRSPSHRPPFLTALALQFASTILFMIGSNPAILVAARCLQGCSSGIVFTIGLALLVDTVGRDEVGAWMGFVLSGMTIGMMIAPFTGGIVYAKVGYYAVFAVALAIIAVDFLLRLVMIEKKAALQWTAKDLTVKNNYGSISNHRNGNHRQGTAGDIDNEVLPDDESGRSGAAANEEDPFVSKPHEVGSATTTTFSNGSWLAGSFSTTYTLLSSSRLMAAIYGVFVNAVLITAFDGILPLFVHRTFGWNSLGSGLMFLALTIPSLSGSIVGALSDRLGTRVVVLSGFASSTLALALLSLVTCDGVHQVALFCVLLALTGVGTTMMLAPLAADMSLVVEQLGKDNETLFGAAGAYAQAYGLFDSALAVGTIVGPAGAGFLYEKGGWRVAVYSLAAFCASGTVPIAFCFAKRDHKSSGC